MEGDPADGLYVVVSGRIKVFLSDNDGKEVVLTVESAGACFGEIALLDEEPRSASVAALENTELLIIYRDQFMDLLDNHPEFVRSLIRSLAHMVRRLTKNVESLALKEVYCRAQIGGRRSCICCQRAPHTPAYRRHDWFFQGDGESDHERSGQRRLY